LIGIDFSFEMLAHARGKAGPNALLAVADSVALPVSSDSVDIVIASFVASYIPDLDAFASELRRVVRHSGRVFVSDMHPETAARCHWDRGYRAAEGHVSLSTFARSISQVTDHFQAFGFITRAELEPPFGLPELEIFCAAGKLDAFENATGLPAIYILELEAGRENRSSGQDNEKRRNGKLFHAKVSLDAFTAIDAGVEVNGRTIATVANHRAKRDGASGTLNLSDCLLLPGLINAHDHLEFGLYPNLGRGPYVNSAQWANDIQQNDREVITVHQQIPKKVRLWWGGIRNLLCGVTTVCHHNPLVPEFVDEDFPIHVLRDFGWAHSLAMDSELDTRFKSTPSDLLFFVHGCEGVDETARCEIYELDARGILQSRTMLIHGLAMNDEGVSLMNRRGATLVWCPTSNRFLFGRTHTRESIASFDRVLLGSDSPLTSAGDLLDEIRMAHHDIGIAASELYAMVCTHGGSFLRLGEGQGTIRPDALADLVAVRDSGLVPSETLVNLSTSDIELVMVSGRVNLASQRMYERMTPEIQKGLEPLTVEAEIRWVRAPLQQLFQAVEPILGREIRLGGKRVQYAGTN
jgi:cytosine/adenosine deaminase-related metal-dependent hydrolase